MPKAKKPAAFKVRSATPVDVQIGIRIRAMRMDRGISQQELGEKIGVSFQQVQKYERGVNRLSMVRASQIVAHLGTTIEQLMGTSGQKTDGYLFDAESYKLAKAFNALPEHIKPKLRSLINSIIGNADAE